MSPSEALITILSDSVSAAVFSHVFTMKSALHIDLETARATISEADASLETVDDERWLQFLARLAYARRRDDAWVTAGHIAELTGWKGVSETSVGKIVAKRVDRQIAIGRCVDNEKVTQRWRLPADLDLHVVQDDAQLRSWLSDRGMAAPALPTTVEWLTNVVHAQIAFYRGEAADAVRAAELALEHSTEGRSLKVSALLLIRAEDSRGGFHEARDRVEKRLAIARGVDPSIQDVVWGTDPLGRHCQTRLASMEALRSYGASAAAHRTAIESALKRAKDGADLSREAILYNTLGVLSRRQGDCAEARFHLADAIALSLIVNDLFTLGGAIFNLALTALVEKGTRSKSDDVAFARALLAIAIKIDEKVGIGRSSAQAEILLARLLAGTFEFEESGRLIETAFKMVQRTHSPYDNGCLLLARAELAWARGLQGQISRHEALTLARRCLDEAERFFLQTDNDGWHYAHEQLTRLDRGDGVALPWRTCPSA